MLLKLSCCIYNVFNESACTCIYKNIFELKTCKIYNLLLELSKLK